MKPISVEFSAKVGEAQYREESVGLHSTQELFEFVAPGGGCEAIPDEVVNLKMSFLAPAHPNTRNPTADCAATLQIGLVFFTGPLAEIVQAAEQILDKAGRGELSESFRRMLHITT